MRVAVLGGTTEARALAGLLHRSPDITVETSLAGPSVAAGPPLPGSSRFGRFAGPPALAAYLAEFDRVIDATHPFAAVITEQAVAAAATVGRPLLVLRRPGWQPGPGDDWHRVASTDAAAGLISSLAAATVLLTIGRTGLGAFATDPRHFVIRSIEAPPSPLPVNRTVLLEPGPFTVDGELELIDRFDVGVLVTKDSGASAVAAKLTAARIRRRPVVMIDRPRLPAGVEVVDSAIAALAWVVNSSRRHPHCRTSRRQ